MKDLRNPIFHDEKKARLHLEKLLWPGGPVCPHCGSLDGLAKVTKKRKLNKTKTDEGKKPHPQRPGLYYCNNCKGQFTVTVGTVFEKSKVPLTKWLLGFHLMASSKKGISAHQLHRNLKVTYKTAWFMAHRIRECMKPGSGKLPLGGPGKTIEADETYFGKRENPRPSAQRKGLYLSWQIRRKAPYRFACRTWRQRAHIPCPAGNQGRCKGHSVPQRIEKINSLYR